MQLKVFELDLNQSARLDDDRITFAEHGKNISTIKLRENTCTFMDCVLHFS